MSTHDAVSRSHPMPDELPYFTAGIPGIGGVIKQCPEDFEVEEIPAYEPSGQGDYAYVWMEKRDMGAEYFVRQIARRVGIPVSEVGTAGNKDRRAVTRQMVSIPYSAVEKIEQLNGDGMAVLSVSRHGNKLKPGHLHGNRFRIRVRSPHDDSRDRLEAILRQIDDNGLPNFYGSQRFGRGNETLHLGLEMLGVGGAASSRKRHKNRFLTRLALSAVQSWAFNNCLVRRLKDGLLRRVLAGDVMMKWPQGGIFRAEDVQREQERFDARETVTAGPIFGKKMFPASGDAAYREEEALKDLGLSSAEFAGFGKLLQGTRRHNMIYVNNLTSEFDPDGVRISFSLPAGSYATVLLREVMKSSSAEELEERVDGSNGS